MRWCLLPLQGFPYFGLKTDKDMHKTSLLWLRMNNCNPKPLKKLYAASFFSYFMVFKLPHWVQEVAQIADHDHAHFWHVASKWVHGNEIWTHAYWSISPIPSISLSSVDHCTKFIFYKILNFISKINSKNWISKGCANFWLTFLPNLWNSFYKLGHCDK